MLQQVEILIDTFEGDCGKIGGMLLRHAYVCGYCGVVGGY